LNHADKLSMKLFITPHVFTTTYVPNIKNPQNETTSEYCPRQSLEARGKFPGAARRDGFHSAGKNRIRQLTKKTASKAPSGPLTKKPNRPQRLPLGYRTQAKSIPNHKANQYPMAAQKSKIKT
jgi:hypothetical protein